ncbi:MAG: TolC family protein, partial [Planctomycetaceae bacterium]|nr:TolC family protein [Planctomycetaceae bacterium]
MICPSVFLRRKLLLGLTACAVIGSMGGCHRAMYRQQADDDARALVEEKSCDPRWALPCFNIEMNPASRYYDQYDPVKPPMPPDDPESHDLMHCVYGKKGWAKWHKDGDRSGLENPTWQQCLDQYVTRSQSGAYVLRLEDSVRLALIHSPAYQQQLETLYLSSLDVSTERFRLDTQFFGGNSTFYNHRGPDPTGSGVGNTAGGGAGVYGGSPRSTPFGAVGDTLRTTTGVEARRRLATAGELVVGFANSFVWQFAGPDQSSAASLASFSFLQPLLRAGGRVVGLERLTLAERTLLANVRAMYRYRQGFFTQIAIGDNNGVTGPQRRGGFTGAGLEGFTGVGTGGFGGVGDATGFGGGGGNNNQGAGGGGGGTTGFAGGGAGLQNGFIGLLQQLQQMRNLQELLKAQARTRPLLEANLAAGLIDIAQVDQFRQNIETERANMLSARNQLETALDQFKIQTLGLPPHVPIELNDSLIKQFQFIDPDLGAAQDSLAQILSDLGDLGLKPAATDLEAMADRIAASRRDIEEQIGVVLNDLQKLETLDGARFRDVTPEDQQTTREEWTRLKETHKRLIDDHAETGAILSEIRAELKPDTTDKVMGDLVLLAVRLDNLVKELALVQARSRLELITVEPVELNSFDALAIARANRVDWMNNRATLVDTWRLIEFNANALESGLDIVISGDVGTTGVNPVEFTHTTGALRAGL